jgi:hypothetical protein
MPQQRCRTAHVTPSAAPGEHGPGPRRSQAKAEVSALSVNRERHSPPAGAIDGTLPPARVC